ncbi:hypothetical protein LOD99_13615 [Oopsacas minuta]|uniref:HP domain-containing protein n=1 Tax=Oopsacas minuta TaxID=111878 RepID=A0AAV7KHL5_9METZ|nr:hypothetical protein LOD99_13615 [Oopsacas minuta]
MAEIDFINEVYEDLPPPDAQYLSVAPTYQQDGLTNGIQYPSLTSTSSSFDSPTLPKDDKQTKLVNNNNNSSSFTSYQQEQKQIDSTDDDNVSQEIDSDLCISSGDHSYMKVNDVVENEISDLLGSLKLRDKSGSSGGGKRDLHLRHSFHAPPTHNEIREQAMSRRRTVSTSTASDTGNPFLLSSSLTSSARPSNSLDSSLLIGSTNQLFKGLAVSPIRENYRMSSPLHRTHSALPSVTPPKATVAKTPKYTAGSANRTTTSTTPKATVVRTSPRATGSATKTNPQSRNTPITPKSTSSAAVRRTPQLNSSAGPKIGAVASMKGPAFSKSRSATGSRVVSSNRTGLGERIRNNPQGRPKTPTLAPGFQNLSVRKTSNPVISQSTRSRPTSQGVGSASSNSSLNSSLKGSIKPITRYNTYGSTESLQTPGTKTGSANKNQNSTSPKIQGSSGISSPGKTTPKHTPTSNYSPDKQRTGVANKQTASTLSRQINSPVRTQSPQTSNPIRTTTSNASVASRNRSQTAVTPVNTREVGKNTTPSKTPSTATTRNPNQYNPITRSKSVNATIPPTRLATKVQSATFLPPAQKKASAGAAPFKRTPIITANPANSPHNKSAQIKSTQTNSPQTKSTHANSPQTKSTQANSPQTKSTQANSPQTKSTQANSPQIKSTQANSPQIKSTQANSPQIKSTQANSPQIKSTQAIPSLHTDKSILPPNTVTSHDNDPFGIPLIAPTRPKEYDHRLQVRNKLPARPTRGLIQQNATENHLNTIKRKVSVSCPNSPRATPDLYSAGENPIQTKLDVKTFKFLLKPRDKESLLMGAAERSPIYTSHEHVLIKVKGKRQVHARITEPKVTSMNKGNAYIFISLTELWLWVGPDANPAEVSKARSLANRIFKQKELGCKAIFLSEIDFREQNTNTTRTYALFNALEGTEKEIRASTSEDSDEIYEKGMALVTKVYEVVSLPDGNFIATIIHEDKYISVKTNMLKTEKVLIFDFGTEVYLWVGKQSAANPQLRKQGEKMAKEIFDNCYAAPSFDPNHILTKTNSPNKNTNSLSLMTNRATGQIEKNLEGKAIGVSSPDHAQKVVQQSPQRNPAVKQTNPQSRLNSANKSKTVSPLKTNTNTTTKRIPSTVTRDRVMNVNTHLTASTPSTGRAQASRASSTPPKKTLERKTAATPQPPGLGRAMSTARGTILSENTSHLHNRPRSQEGNREDMLAPEHKTPVYTNQVRPAYSVLARMNEGAETVLFGDKFSDWKGALGIISTKPAELGKKNLIAAHIELTPCDTKLMLQERKVPSSIVDPVVNRLKADNVKTVSLKKWLVKEYNNEFKHFELNHDEFPLFYSNECYVYKWIYEHTLFPIRKNNLKTTSATKERGMIFFWQGDECSINAKGAVAAISIEIDEDGNLHKERLPQGKEDALFLQLFNGKMTVYLGKSDDNHNYDKFFFVRGSTPSETCLIEIPPENLCLNSLGCYVYTCEADQTVYAWRGANSSPAQNACLETVVEKITIRKNFTIVLINEGESSNIFDKFTVDSSSIVSATGAEVVINTPHLFELCGASGQFTFNQYIPQIYTNEQNPLIFLQLDLYSAQQPTIFMLDVYYEVYIWFGWWPNKTHNSRNHVTSESLTNTGVSDTRWQGDKKLAIQTALNYVKDAGRMNCPVYVTFAGSEPESFKHLFPFWIMKKDLNGVSRNDNPFHPRGKVLAEDLLATYTRTRYTYEELTRRPLPEGVDPGKLEMYLSEQEFESIFNMKKIEFGKMQSWKQKLLREQYKLY